MEGGPGPPPDPALREIDADGIHRVNQLSGGQPLCRAKTRTPMVTLCFLRSLGRSPVFADQTLVGEVVASQAECLVVARAER
jgi:hypothetical protein